MTSKYSVLRQMVSILFPNSSKVGRNDAERESQRETETRQSVSQSFGNSLLREDL